MAIEDKIVDNEVAIDSVIDLLALLLADRKFPAGMLPTGAFGLADDGSVFHRKRGLATIERYENRDGSWVEVPPASWFHDDATMVRLVPSNYMYKAP